MSRKNPADGVFFFDSPLPPVRIGKLDQSGRAHLVCLIYYGITNFIQLNNINDALLWHAGIQK